jgi:hypothetical protein
LSTALPMIASSTRRRASAGNARLAEENPLEHEAFPAPAGESGAKEPANSAAAQLLSLRE